MIISRSIHIAANGIISFFFMLSSIPLYIMYHIFFIHLSVDGHLCYFHVLAIVNSAVMNIEVRVSFQIRVLSGYVPKRGIAGSYGNSVFSFLRNLMLFSTVAVIFLLTYDCIFNLCQQCASQICIKTTYPISVIIFLFLYQCHTVIIISLIFNF